MAITVLQAPEPVALVKNPVVFKLHTDNYITTPATFSGLVLHWSSLPSNGDQITLSWGNNVITFTFVTGTPDNTGTQIQIPASFTYPDFSNILISWFQKNYILQNDFSFDPSINLVGPLYGLVFLGLKSGSDYNIAVTESLGNLTVGSTLAVDEVKRPNFKIIFRVGLSYTEVFEMAQVPDADGNCTFEVQEILSAYFEPYISDGFFSVTENEERQSILPYGIKYAESYGDTPVVYSIDQYIATDPAILAVLNGGVKKIDFPDLNFFSEFLPETKMFLTWEPTDKIVSPAQIEQLGFLFYADPVSFNRLMKVYFTDGTSQTVTLSTGTVTYAGYLWFIPAGPTELGVSAINPEKIVLKYDLWITNSSNVVVSEVRTFVLDYKQRIFERIFIYKNSFGVDATLRTTGEVIAGNKNQDSLSERIIPDDYLISDFEAHREDVVSDDSFTVNTGFFPSIEWKKAFRDFLRSDNVHEYKEGKFIPVIILTKEDSYKESDPLYSSKFEYKYAFTDKAYSNANNIL